MFKPGIWTAAQLLQGKKWFRCFRLPSLALLDLHEDTSREDVARFERIIFDARLSSGVYRTTYSKRFADLDLVATKLICEQAWKNKVIIHDWACSDGRTSVEWAESIFPKIPEAEFWASDRSFHLWQANLAKASLIFDADGLPLQYIHPPFVVDLCDGERLVFLFNKLAQWVGTQKARKIAPPSWPPVEGVVDDVTWRTISLKHPLARQFARRHPRFHFLLHDAFTSLPSQCHVVRTMNIFNYSYFGASKLLEGIRAVRDSLLVGGLWIVGRTLEEADRKNNSTILVKTESGWKVLQRLGSGSELEILLIENKLLERS